MPHQFGYSVKDDYAGTDFAHSEDSDGNTVKGSYTVQLPDGRKQTVGGAGGRETAAGEGREEEGRGRGGREEEGRGREGRVEEGRGREGREEEEGRRKNGKLGLIGRNWMRKGRKSAMGNGRSS